MVLEHEDDNHQQEEPEGIEASQSSSQSVLTLVTEIIVEILSRLPVDSLLRCRSVCKSWRSLISDPHFVKSHHTLSTSNNHYAHHRLIVSTGTRTELKTCHLHDVLYDNSINALVELDHPLKDPFNSVWIIGSCNGLLCIAIEEDLIIWNPSTRKSNRLPCSGGKVRRGWYVMYGFGYEESNDDYKVIEISCIYNDKEWETCIKIWSLKDGNWKEIGAFPHDIPLIDSGKFSNGALHWAHWGASEEIGSSYPWAIFSLDLAKETYGEVLQPVYDEGYKDLTLGSLNEWLCVLCYYGDRVDLWVMKLYGVKDSWTKLVSIPYLTCPQWDRFSIPLCISNDGKFVLQSGQDLVIYDSKNISFSKLQNFDDCLEACTFVESLVSPDTPTCLGDG